MANHYYKMVNRCLVEVGVFGPMKIWQLNQEQKEENHRDQAWHLVTREGSISRVVWKTHSSSSAKHSVVSHATTSTDIEVGEDLRKHGRQQWWRITKSTP